LIGRHGVVSSLTKCVELMSPRIPTLREAVAQHNQRARASFRNVHPNSVGVHKAVVYLIHGSSRNNVAMPRL
jgi:hypothetical protein